MDMLIDLNTMKKQHKFCSLNNVYLGKLCPYGHDHDGNGNSYRHVANKTCVECQRIRIGNWAKTEKGKESLRKRKLKHKCKAAITSRDYRKNNREKICAYNKKYRVDNLGWYLSYYRIYNATRKTRKQNATPRWINNELINDIYRLANNLTTITGVKHEVDHIIPLKNKNVCGLHVHENLRVITATENRKKHNKLLPELITDGTNGGNTIRRLCR